MNLAAELRRVFERIAENPVLAANDLDALAARLSEMAQAIRMAGGNREPGGATDQVKLRVVGPDGTTKQETET